MKNNKSTKSNRSVTMKKHDFIDFLSSSSPEEINNYIKEKGKPRKLIDPIYYYDKEEKNK